MRRSALAAVLVLAAASSAAGQWLERTISLADPLFLRWVSRIESNPVHGFVYVGGGGGVLVVDAATLEKQAVLGSEDRVIGLHYEQTTDRLYALTYESMVVYDGASHVELRRVAVPDEPEVMVHDSSGNRLLVFHQSETGVLSVFDMAADSVVQQVVLDSIWYLKSIVPNPVHNKVYVGDGEFGRVAVVDLAAGVVTRYLRTEDFAGTAYNPVADKFYWTDYGEQGIWVLDGKSDSTIGFIDLDTVLHDLGLLKFNRKLNKLYAWELEGRTLLAIDGGGDSLVAVVECGGRIYPDSLVLLDEEGDRLYCHLYGKGLAVVDCQSDSILKVVPGAMWPEAQCLDPVLGRHFAAEQRALWAIDCSLGQVAGVVPLCNYQDLAWVGLDEDDDRLYCWLDRVRMLTTVQASTGRVLGRMPVRAVESAWYTVNPILDRVHALVVTDYQEQEEWLYSIEPGDSTMRAMLQGREDRGVGSHWAVPERRQSYYAVRVRNPDRHYYLVAADWETDQLGEQVPLDDAVNSAVFDPGRGNAYLALNCDRLVRLDLDSHVTDTLLEGVSMECRLALDPVLGKLYLLYTDRVAIYGIEQDSILAVTGQELFRGQGAFVCDTLRHLLFCRHGDSVLVIGGEAERAIAIIPVGLPVSSLFWNPASGTVMCFGGGKVAFLDWETQGVVATIDLGGGIGTGLAWDAANSRMYVIIGDARVAVIRDTLAVAVPEEPPPATLVRGFLTLAVGDTGALLDVTGRKLLNLLPGRNELGAFAPGVYFLRTAEDGGDPAVRKVIVQR